MGNGASDMDFMRVLVEGTALMRPETEVPEGQRPVKEIFAPVIAAVDPRAVSDGFIELLSDDSPRASFALFLMRMMGAGPQATREDAIAFLRAAIEKVQQKRTEATEQAVSAGLQTTQDLPLPESLQARIGALAHADGVAQHYTGSMDSVLFIQSVLAKVQGAAETKKKEEEDN